MIDSRRCPNDAQPSWYAPSPSGPRCPSAASILCMAAARVRSAFTIPAMPHIGSDRRLRRRGRDAALRMHALIDRGLEHGFVAGCAGVDEVALHQPAIALPERRDGIAARV